MVWRPGAGRKAHLYGRWGTRKPRLELGDFWHQRGVYVLHGDHGAYYAGLAIDQPLGKRLQQHTQDEHAGRWDKFSWFGYCEMSRSAQNERYWLPQPLHEEGTATVRSVIRDAEAMQRRCSSSSSTLSTGRRCNSTKDGSGSKWPRQNGLCGPLVSGCDGNGPRNTPTTRHARIVTETRRAELYGQAQRAATRSSQGPAPSGSASWRRADLPGSIATDHPSVLIDNRHAVVDVEHGTWQSRRPPGTYGAPVGHGRWTTAGCRPRPRNAATACGRVRLRLLEVPGQGVGCRGRCPAGVRKAAARGWLRPPWSARSGCRFATQQACLLSDQRPRPFDRERPRLAARGRSLGAGIGSDGRRRRLQRRAQYWPRSDQYRVGARTDRTDVERTRTQYPGPSSA